MRERAVARRTGAGNRPGNTTATDHQEEEAKLNCFFHWHLGGGRHGRLVKVCHTHPLPSLLPSGSPYATALPQLNDLQFLKWLLAEPETLILHWSTQARRQLESEQEKAERLARRRQRSQLNSENVRAKDTIV